MSLPVTTGLLLIALPLAFNAAFGALAAMFDYPDVLRRPTSEVLAKFRAGGSRLVLVWWLFTMTALALAPLAVLVGLSLHESGLTIRIMMMTVGVLASVVQFLGIARWPFLVPYLARADADASESPARRETVDVVFQSFNHYLGVGVGEHLGYLLTGCWSVLVGIGIMQGADLADWLGVVGIVIGAFLVLCSFEFVGPFEPKGWKLAGTLIPFVYIAWSIWLIAFGIALMLSD